MKYHLIEDEHDLQYNLIIFLFGLKHTQFQYLSILKIDFKNRFAANHLEDLLKFQ